MGLRGPACPARPKSRKRSTAAPAPSFCSIAAILPSRPARATRRRAQRRSRMARLRATAPAARTVLDGREHDGRLPRVGAAISPSNKQTIKKRPRTTIKKRNDAYGRTTPASLARAVIAAAGRAGGPPAVRKKGDGGRRAGPGASGAVRSVIWVLHHRPRFKTHRRIALLAMQRPEFRWRASGRKSGTSLRRASAGAGFRCRRLPQADHGVHLSHRCKDSRDFIA